MSKSVVLETALSLPACDIEALIQGRMIAVIPRTFINPGRQFALYPTNLSINLQPHQRYYRSSFLTITQTTLAKIPCDNVVIKAWARCEGCKMYSPELFDTLSQLTVWTKEALQLSLGQRPHIFLAYLRVYLLSDYLDILSQSQNSQFLPLRPSLNVSEDKPILTDRTFTQRKHQLENLQPPLHPELEELQSAIAQLSQTNSVAQKLDNDIKIFLGWNSRKLETPDSDLVWIDKIAEVGNSSDGHTFEKFVRRGLLKLGFTGSGLNPDATGGAGGMDFYAEQPYPIVGECKATKTEKVTDGTPAQLLKIGMNHLGKFQYENSIKLIVAAGELNFYALRTATENQMNVISPETLQKLVELQAHYKNSINLLELKECLQQSPFGLAEDKVNSYIDKVEKSLNLRSHILQLLKKHLEKTGDLNVGIDALVVAYIYDSPPETLKDKELYEILIELSSPLTGYLGRIKGSDWKSDRFYFLRDLAITLK
ncbi:MAG: DUF1802 family protein [Nostoc sp. GBBB01]|uniref:DUF1802 family protein n=1 Tax=Nostoc punctiforme FACHB-252 TaxID=1357509 RepID=A0ABR8HCF1_NOSPU|nr:DUF1802 family protein [Nostoc punctiforme]MBD2613331.1 DUF1802 family protein [Nostoc punctiforme FACHB-252]MBL1199260.1 DUF1802 family protein [Nostoc sp. GBBB01]